MEPASIFVFVNRIVT